MRSRIAWILMAACLCLPQTALATGSLRSPTLPRYKSLEPNVAFWHDVFTEHASDKIVFHDSRHLGLVYSVLDVSDIAGSLHSEARKERSIRQRRDAEAKRVVALLRGLAKSPPRSPEQERVLEAIKGLGHERAYATKLAAQVRSQRGLADKFCPSVERAAPLVPVMKRIMREHGVPEQLSSLPLVESGYQTGAHSSAGAVGMWQFTHSTGRLFLNIDHLYDERRDPIAATTAAAKLLSHNYEKLGTWPLAITAYNHGSAGMARAVRTVGTKNFGEIAESYNGRTFGFASRNFYAEFLAADEAMRHADEKCRSMLVPPYKRDVVELDAHVLFSDLAKSAGLDKDELAAHNPALRSQVMSDRYRVPSGYKLNLPSGTQAAFAKRYAKLPASARLHKPPSYMVSHRVRHGQTLSHIARANGTSISTLKYINNIRDPRRLRAGQLLKVPGPGWKPSSSSSTKVVAKASAPPRTTASGTHLVGRGQTLSQIARMYRCTVDELKRLNGISDPRKLRRGQQLRLPSGTGVATTTHAIITKHRVSAGESLWSIAAAYGTSVPHLQSLNGIRNPSRLRAGRVLSIPDSGSSYHKHKVASGQTLSYIASKYRTSVEALQRVNGISDPRRLRPGQVLRVPM